MDVGEVVQVILDELEIGQVDVVEGDVIGIVGVVCGYGGGIDIVEWCELGFEDWYGCQVFLCVDVMEVV